MNKKIVGIVIIIISLIAGLLLYMGKEDSTNVSLDNVNETTQILPDSTNNETTIKFTTDYTENKILTPDEEIEEWINNIK